MTEPIDLTISSCLKNKNELSVLYLICNKGILQIAKIMLFMKQGVSWSPLILPTCAYIKCILVLSICE